MIARLLHGVTATGRRGRWAAVGVATVLALAFAAAGGTASASGTATPSAAVRGDGTVRPSVTAGASGATAQPGAQSWPVAGQNTANTRDQAAETAISPSNVGQLAPEMVSVKTAGDVTATPTVANGTVYFPDMGGMLWAVTSTGARGLVRPGGQLYRDPRRRVPGQPGHRRQRADHRGWLDGNKINGTAHVFAVNRTTGALLWSVQVDTDPASIITGSPTLYNGVVYAGVSSYEESDSPDCCTFRGAVVALSAATGQILWKTYTVPSNNNGSDSNLPRLLLRHGGLGYCAGSGPGDRAALCHDRQYLHSAHGGLPVSPARNTASPRTQATTSTPSSPCSSAPARSPGTTARSRRTSHRRCMGSAARTTTSAPRRT